MFDIGGRDDIGPAITKASSEGGGDGKVLAALAWECWHAGRREGRESQPADHHAAVVDRLSDILDTAPVPTMAAVRLALETAYLEGAQHTRMAKVYR